MFKKLIEKWYLSYDDIAMYIDPQLNCKTSQYFYRKFLKAHKNSKLILASVDCENLKQTNDTYGHAAGDLLLKSVVDELQDYGMVIRLGGDEFLLILDEDKMEKFVKGDHKHFSYGIVVKEKDDDIVEKMQEADASMYINKREKKGLLEKKV